MFFVSVKDRIFCFLRYTCVDVRMSKSAENFSKSFFETVAGKQDLKSRLRLTILQFLFCI